VCIGFAKYMNFSGKIIAGLFSHVISATTRIITPCGLRGNYSLLCARLIASFKESSTIILHFFNTSCHLTNRQSAYLIPETPGFPQNKCTSALSYCKSKRVESLKPLLKSGVFSFLKYYPKRVLICLMLLMAFVGRVNGAIRYSVAVGNWNATTTWSATSGGAPGASVPVAGDDVTIERGFNVTVTANSACTSITYTTVTATILSINSGITLNVSGAITIPRAGAGVNTLAVGAGVLNAGSIAFTNGGGNVRHLITISTGTVTVAGDVTQTGSNGSASFTFTGAGLLRLGGAFLNSTTGTLTTVAGSTVEYFAAGVQTIGDFTYGNLDLSGSGTKTAAGVITVNGTTTLSGVEFNTGGFNSSLGVLAMTLSSTLNMASVANTIIISNSSSATWIGTLSVTEWIMETNHIMMPYGSLTAAQLSQISFSGYSPGSWIVGSELFPLGLFPPGNSTFTVPAGVTCIQIEAWGGGGKGGTRTFIGGIGSGGGGGGGAYSRNVLSVIPGNSYTVSVGAGSNTTAPGGDTYFINTSTILAKGGSSVGDNISTGVNGGVASSGVGDIRWSGGSGANGTGSNGGGGGSSAGDASNGLTATNQTGATAPTGGGNGGDGKFGVQGTGTDGSSPGGGGGGAYRTSGQTRIGGYGAPGQLIITWIGLTGTNIPVVTSPIFPGATTISGTSEAGATIVVYADGAQIGTTIANGSGAWAVLVSARTLGQVITATAKVVDKCLSSVSPPVTVLSPNSIITGTIYGSPFCAGSTVSVPYTISGTYNAGNIFTAQLSNASGSFVAPVPIGSIASTTSGTISATIPAGTASGTLYRIRVVSSNPVVTTDNGSNLTINALVTPLVSISSTPVSPICTGTSVNFTATPTNGGTYQWQLNGGTVGSDSPNYTTTGLSNGDQVTCVMTSNATCVSTPTVNSNVITISVINGVPDQPGIITGDATPCAGSSQIYSVTNVPGVTYNWSFPADWIVGGSTNNSITVLSVGTNTGDITVTPSNVCGNGTVSTLSIGTINTMPSGTGNPTLPNVQTKCVGSSVTFSVVASGSPAPTYQWRNVTTLTDIPGATGNSYTIPSISTSDAGFYQVRLTNSCGYFDVGNWQLIINPLPTLSGASQLATVCEGSAATINLTGLLANSTSTVTYTINGVDQTPVAGVIATSSGAAGFTSALLTAANDGQNLQITGITVTSATPNCSRSFTQNVTLRVNSMPTASAGGSQTICSNGNATVSGASYSNGTISWAENGAGSITSGTTTLTPTYTAAAGDAGNTVTLTMTVSNSPCAVATATYSVIVNPVPAITDIATSVCSGLTFTVSPVNITNGTVPVGTTYSWLAPSVTGITGTADGINASSISGTLTNTTNAPIAVTYSVSPKAGSCPGVAFIVTVTVNPAVGIPTPIAVSAGVEPACRIIPSSPTTTYSTTATNNTGFNWSLNNAAAGSINNSSGVMTWNVGFTGIVDIQVIANGCYGPSPMVTRTVIVHPTVGTPTIPSVSAGTEPTCQLTNGTTTTTYSSNASDNTGFNWSLSDNSAGTIDPGTGVMTWANGYSGTVNIQVTANGCNGPSAQVSRTVIVSPKPTATISYSGTPFCTTVATGLVTLNGTGNYTGGTYSASPSGLTINASTGTINPGGSTPGSYTVTYSIAAGGCGNLTATATVVITPLPTATISYAGNPFCKTVGTAQPVSLSGTNAYGGGTYSASPAGLTINAATGAITPSASTAGIYTVSYAIPASGGCMPVPATVSVTITSLPVATFNYSGSPYCSNTSNPSPTFTGGGVAGTFSASPAGLQFISTATGQIDLQNSVPGGPYTVTNTIAASGGCGQVSATNTVTITTVKSAVFSYTSSPYCSNEANPSPTFGVGGSAGTFSSTAGLVFISTATGQINLSASTPGTYVVTNTITASGGCSASVATSSITITPLPVANFSYTGSPYCANVGDPSPTFSGGGVAGVFSATPSGLVFVSTASGQIDILSSNPGTYTVTNTIVAAGGCSTVIATSSVIIGTRPIVTVDYCIASPKIRLIATYNASYTYSWNYPLSGILNYIDVDIADIYGVTVTIPGCGAITVFSTVSNELVTGGDFTTGIPPANLVIPPAPGSFPFTSDYTYKQDVPGLVPANQGELYDDSGSNAYSITTSGQNVHINFWGHDHTFNSSGARNFMAVNGHGNTLVVWKETVTVLPLTNYYFSGWAQSLNSVGNNANLQFSVNGTLVGTTAALANHGESTGSPDTWMRFYGIWPSGAGTTTANIAINDLQSALTGNDFGLDDISFGTLKPAVSTLLSPPGSDNQSACINNQIINIQYSTSGATAAVPSGLPAGVSAAIASNILTISGIPTVTGVFNYTISFTGCGNPFNKTGTITVNPVPVIGDKTATACSGNAFTVTPTTSGTDVVPAGTKYSWSAPSVSGGMTGGAAGTNLSSITGTLTNPTTTIQTATYIVTPLSGTCPGNTFIVTVTVNPTSSITSVSGTNSPQCIDATTTFIANGVVLSGGTGTWNSDNYAVASVDASGKVTATGAGTCNIIYTITGGCGGTVSSSKPVTVNANVTAGTITGTSPLCIGVVNTFTSNGTTGGTWSSDNTIVATVNPGSGVVTTLTNGTTNITYNVSGCGGPGPSTFALTVNPNAPSYTVSGASPLCIGTTANYTKTSALPGTWTSTDPTIALVNPASGLVTAVGAGSCNIVYTLTGSTACGGTLTAQQGITVSPNESVSSVTGASPLCIGASANYQANGVVLGGPLGTGSWNSSNTAIATVDAAGLVKGVAAGTCDIIYTIKGGCSGVKTAQQSVIINGAPNITTPPATPLATCTGSGTQTMSVTATGAGLTYEWRKGGTVLVNGGAVSGQGTSTLTLTNPTTADAGSYVVVVNGTCTPAATSNAVAVTVNTSPFITVQPVAPLATCSGSGIQTISVTATGSGLTYQWRKGGVAVSNGGVISGQGTTTLTLTNPIVADAGSYDVVVNGTCSPFATSNVVALTVNALPTAPIISSITQPTCALATGSVDLGGLPVTPWTVKATPGGATIFGSTATANFTGLLASTSYTFTVTLNSSGCTSAASGNAVINAQPLIPPAPTGATSQSLCTTASPTVADLTATGIAIQWYAASSGGTVLPNATALANNTHYYASQTMNGCESISRLDVTVTLLGGTLSPATQNVCQLNNCSPITLTGTWDHILRWEKSSDGGVTWISIAGTTNTLINQFQLDGTFLVRAVLTNNDESITCNSGTAQVIVDERPAISGWGGQTVICLGQTINNLLSSPGTVTRWEYKYSLTQPSDWQTLSWIPIAGTNQNTYSPIPALAGYYKYHAIVSNGVCVDVPTTNNTVEILVNTLPTISGTLTVIALSTTQLTGSGTAAAVNPWVSASPGVATVSNTGLVTGLSAGTSVITYTDSNGCSTSVTITVTLNNPPVITCPAALTPTTDPDLCSASLTITPATATGNGVIITGVRSDSKPLTDPYPVGTTTIHWTATNTSGTDFCNQTITVTDKQPPSFSLLTSDLSYCVNDIQSAVFNPNPNLLITPVYDDLTTPRPDYYRFTPLSTILDLDPSALKNNFNDNCCPVGSLVLHWEIFFTATSDPSTVAHNPILKPPITDQIGQPSLYPSIIDFPGDGVTFLDVIHHINYWLVDCNGNQSAKQTVNIVIKPRPNLVKVP